MKELLYIPSGRYVKFNSGKMSIEEYLIMCLERFCDNSDSYGTVWETSYDIIIKAFCSGAYTNKTYQSAEIDRDRPMLESEFELIDT